MRSLSTKFLIAVGVFAIAFSGFIFSRTWSVASSHIKELTARQADLALEFNLAIRDYIGTSVRPVMQEMVGEDEFIPETMSTSFVARRIFDKVRKKFPDYIIKFSAENPRNPTNRAGPQEIEIIRHFKKDPQAKSWVGRIEMDGLEYWAHFSPRRMKKSCLRCHGNPEHAPMSLTKRYGAVAGFDRSIGDVALDTVAIPMAKVNAALRSEATGQIFTVATGLFLLFGSIFVAFRYVVTRRLVDITGHFERAALSEGKAPISPVEVGGRDEISVLASSFNTLAAKLHAVHVSLEKRVEDRTRELAEANEELQAKIKEQKRTEDALKASEANYRAIFNAANDAIFVHDISTGEILDVNRKMGEMYGYSHEEATRLTVGDISSGEPPYTQEDALEWIRKAARGEPQLFEWISKNASGELFWVEVSLRHAVIGGQERLLAVVRDITERKRAEEERA